ncbi:hypothetical protein Tco_0800578 [Tanacetum coccineum]|uniref:Reverse transcriptase domain-containing protein n=1 Tax=Tanacetum coccineum TaxID=301880 RepID=A0ABQ4ZX97_9ASTR
MPAELGCFDAIIGKNWLSKYHVVIVCDEKIVRIPYGNEITILKTNTPYPSRKIRRIRACTHQRPHRNKDQYAVSRGLNTPYSRYGINIIFWKISSVVPTLRNPQYAVSNSWICRDLDNSTSNVMIPLDSWTSGLLVYKLPLSVEYGVSISIGYGVSSSLSNTAYSSQQINTAYPLPLDKAYRSSGTEADIFYFRAKLLPFFDTNPTDCLSLVSGAIPTKTVEDAKKAIQEMAEYSQKWHNGTSRGRSTKASDGLAAIQAQLNNLGREIKKVNEKVYAAQVGCIRAYDDAANKENQGASIKALEIQMGNEQGKLQEEDLEAYQR